MKRFRPYLALAAAACVTLAAYASPLGKIREAASGTRGSRRIYQKHRPPTRLA